MNYNFVSTNQSNNITKFAKILDFCKPTTEISRNSQFVINVTETGRYLSYTTKIQVSTVYSSGVPYLDILCLTDNRNHLIVVENSGSYSLYARTNYTGNSIIVSVETCENLAFLKGYHGAEFNVELSSLTYTSINKKWEMQGTISSATYFKIYNMNFVQTTWATPIVATFELMTGVTGTLVEYNSICRFIIRSEIDYAGATLGFVPVVTSGTLCHLAEIHCTREAFNLVSVTIKLPTSMYYKIKLLDETILYPERVFTTFPRATVGSLPSGTDYSIVGA